MLLNDRSESASLAEKKLVLVENLKQEYQAYQILRSEFPICSKILAGSLNADEQAAIQVANSARIENSRNTDSELFKNLSGDFLSEEDYDFIGDRPDEKTCSFFKRNWVGWFPKFMGFGIWPLEKICGNFFRHSHVFFQNLHGPQ